MQTPDTQAGFLTEKIMQRVKEKLPDIQVNEYNRTYEAVLEVLTLRLGKPGDIGKFPGGGGIMI